MDQWVNPSAGGALEEGGGGLETDGSNKSSSVRTEGGERLASVPTFTVNSVIFLKVL